MATVRVESKDSYGGHRSHTGGGEDTGKLESESRLLVQMNTDFGSVDDRAIDDKTAKALAKAVYAGLRSEGCLAGDMISVSALLISLITAEIRHRN